MKALVLSGGKGTRLRPLTHTCAKQLIPIANKPVLFYALEAIVAAGIIDIGMIVGATGTTIRETVGDGSRFGSGVTITYILQESPLGLAHAVKTARPFLGNDKFLMFLGDTFLEEDLTESVQRFMVENCPYQAQVFLASVEQPQQFGVAQLALSDRSTVARPEEKWAHELKLVRVVEKPANPPSNQAIVGIYLFDRHVFDAIERIVPSARGELEITDAIQALLDCGYQVHPHFLQGYWIDTGKVQDVLDANRTILSQLHGQISEQASIDERSKVYGEVVLGENVRLINSLVRGPSVIGGNVTLTNTYIGPFTSIDRNSTIANSEIEHSIILEGCTIRDIVGRIEDSLIGRYTQISPSTARPRAHKLVLGDHCCLGLMSA